MPGEVCRKGRAFLGKCFRRDFEKRAGVQELLGDEWFDEVKLPVRSDVGDGNWRGGVEPESFGEVVGNVFQSFNILF